MGQNPPRHRRFSSKLPDRIGDNYRFGAFGIDDSFDIGFQPKNRDGNSVESSPYAPYPAWPDSFIGHAVECIITPPSTPNACPVIFLPRSDARNATRAAMTGYGRPDFTAITPVGERNGCDLPDNLRGPLKTTSEISIPLLCKLSRLSLWV